MIEGIARVGKCDISDENIESRRTATRGGALRRRRAGMVGKARLAVWVMYWHMYVIVAICRESERPEETRTENGEAAISVGG